LYRIATAEGDYHGDKNGEYVLYANVSRLLPDPAVVFDVGANVGDWSAMACGQAQRPKHLTIHAFEPTSRTYAHLMRRFASDQEDNVRLHRAALSDRAGSATLFLTGNLGGTNTFHRDDICGPGLHGSEEVPTWRGDDFCRDNRIERVDFLKVDTEGHEVAVLAGFAHMLGEQRITWIQFEYGECWVRSRAFFKDAYEVLRGYGYNLAKIFPQGVLPIASYSTEMETFTLSNYLAYLTGGERDLPLIR
jgi:FkbM family methyltransferase